MGWPLQLILLALHTNLGEAQAKLDTTAAARTGGHFRFWKSRNA